MSNRQLLEGAAQAAGLAVEFDDEGGAYPVRDSAGKVVAWWNPLTDDGDAMRLVDALRMLVDVTDDYVSVLLMTPRELRTLTTQFREGRDRMQSIRYAIVRAACEAAERDV